MKNMKKIILVAFLLWFAFFLFIKLTQSDSPTIEFETGDGKKYKAIAPWNDNNISMPPTPTKDGYLFGGWYLDNGTFLIEFTTDTLKEMKTPKDLTLYAKWIKAYTVKFMNDDGITLLGTSTVRYGGAAAPPKNPTKEATEEFSYTFIGWDKEFTNITENLTVRALYKSSINSYTVTFFDDDGKTKLGQSIVKYGSVAVCPVDPFKTRTKEFTYDFVGWDQDTTFIKSNLNVNAVYKATRNKYHVTFLDDKGIKLGSSFVEYGSKAIAPTLPYEYQNKEYKYTFAGWDKDINHITDNTIIRAVYKETKKLYTDAFLNRISVLSDYLSINIQSDNLKTNPNNYKTVWYKEEKQIFDLEEERKKKKLLFKVTFLDEDGVTILGEVIVDKGMDAVVPYIRTKSTPYVTYKIIGWDQDITNVTSDIRVKAIYEVVKNIYNVTFLDEDKVTVLDISSVEYGKSASPPNNVEKAPTDEYTYKFIGWDKDFSYITHNLFVIALYEKTKNKYTVTFLDDTETKILGATTVEYGASANIQVSPKKKSIKMFDYIFVGWNKDISEVTSNLTVKAVFKKVKKTYKVTYYDDDGFTILGTTLVEYGEDAVYSINPKKPSTDKYKYTFIGWDTDCTKVTRDLSVKPLFHKTLQTYNVTFLDKDEVTIINQVTVEYGNSAMPPVAPIKLGHSFIGWKGSYEYIISDTFVYAIYSVNQYTITFDTSGGNIINPITTYYNTEIVKPNNPIKSGYMFNGWYLNEEEFKFDKMPASNITLKAKWKEDVFVDYDMKLNPSKDSYSIDMYYGEEKEVIVPDTYNDLPITSINSHAFSHNHYIQKVILPETIKNIGQCAFEKCDNLTEINIPEGITTIEFNTFADNPKLTSITIPDSVTTIKYRAFRNDVNLIEVKTSKNSLLENVDPGAFLNTKWYSVNEGNNLYLGNVLYVHKDK